MCVTLRRKFEYFSASLRRRKSLHMRHFKEEIAVLASLREGNLWLVRHSKGGNFFIDSASL